MTTLLLLGALVPLHMQRAWRSRRNRVTGTAMMTFNAVLVATSFGLYYAGSEMLRPWMSDIHVIFGLSFISPRAGMIVKTPRVISPRCSRPSASCA